MNKRLLALSIFGGVVLLLVIFASGIIDLIVDYFWFGEIGFAQIFTTILMAKVLTGIAFGLVAFLFVYLNLRIALFLTRGKQNITFVSLPGLDWNKLINKMALLVSLVLALFGGMYGVSIWEIVLKYFNKISFDIADPVFSKDIGYYFFDCIDC